MNNENKRFTGYEYKKITAGVERLAFLLDGYENFGWEQDENFSETGHHTVGEKHTILLKRDRKIINRMELTRLQRNFEACVNEIDSLERAKISRAIAVALMIGVIGSGFLACAVFAIVAQPPYILLCIVLSIPGMIGWILPYFVYRKVHQTQVEKLSPLIDAKYEEIYEICEKGSKLK